MEKSNAPYLLKDKLQRTRYYMGGYWTFIAMSADTGGQFSLIEANLRKGMEPPTHMHTYEDESFYLVQGQMAFTVNGDEQLLEAGGFIHIPKGATHGFKTLSDTARVLIHLAPAGLEAMFLELSQPADKLDYPPAPAGPPSPEWLQKAGVLQQKFGIQMDTSRIKAS
jgi:quercetin dioxygenase-like cupin family protein